MERLEYMVSNKYETIALESIGFYDIKNPVLEFLVEETNVIYKVITDHARYALKIFEEDSSQFEDNQSEAYFLDLIEKNTDLNFPKLVKNKEGEAVTLVYAPEENMTKRVMVYEWMSGDDHKGNESLKSFEQVGEITAQLHQATKNQPLKGFYPKRWNKVFFYKEEVPVYHEEVYKRFIGDDVKKILDLLIPILDDKLNRIYDSNTTHLIHGDLNPWNIKVCDDGVFLIDYEEAMLGCPLHDLATLLYYYHSNHKWPYEVVKEAFIKGYSRYEKFEFDEEHLQTLIIARCVNFINYVLIIRKDPSEFINNSVSILKEYLDKEGILYD